VSPAVNRRRAAEARPAPSWELLALGPISQGAGEIARARLAIGRELMPHTTRAERSLALLPAQIGDGPVAVGSGEATLRLTWEFEALVEHLQREPDEGPEVNQATLRRSLSAASSWLLGPLPEARRGIIRHLSEICVHHPAWAGRILSWVLGTPNTRQPAELSTAEHVCTVAAGFSAALKGRVEDEAYALLELRPAWLVEACQATCAQASTPEAAAWSSRSEREIERQAQALGGVILRSSAEVWACGMRMLNCLRPALGQNFAGMVLVVFEQTPRAGEVEAGEVEAGEVEVPDPEEACVLSLWKNPGEPLMAATDGRRSRVAPSGAKGRAERFAAWLGAELAE